MALVPVDSTNFTVGTNAVSTVSFGTGFRGLRVTSLNGGGTVGYRFDTGTTMTSTNALAADNWYLPPAVGASATHELATEAEAGATSFFVELCASNGTCTVAVTAWA